MLELISDLFVEMSRLVWVCQSDDNLSVQLTTVLVLRYWSIKRTVKDYCTRLYFTVARIPYEDTQYSSKQYSSTTVNAALTIGQQSS